MPEMSVFTFICGYFQWMGGSQRCTDLIHFRHSISPSLRTVTIQYDSISIAFLLPMVSFFKDAKKEENMHPCITEIITAASIKM